MPYQEAFRGQQIGLFNCSKYLSLVLDQIDNYLIYVFLFLGETLQIPNLDMLVVDSIVVPFLKYTL